MVDELLDYPHPTNNLPYRGRVPAAAAAAAAAAGSFVARLSVSKVGVGWTGGGGDGVSYHIIHHTSFGDYNHTRWIKCRVDGTV